MKAAGAPCKRRRHVKRLRLLNVDVRPTLIARAAARSFLSAFRAIYIFCIEIKLTMCPTLISSLFLAKPMMPRAVLHARLLFLMNIETPGV